MEKGDILCVYIYIYICIYIYAVVNSIYVKVVLNDIIIIQFLQT